MKRKPSPPAKDIRAPWQIAQAAACPCRGTDDMCQCQNERPEDRRPTRADLEQRIRELEGAVRTLELQQQTDRQTIASLSAARPAVVSDEVVEAMCRAHSASHRQSDDWDRFGPRTQAEHKAAMRAALALLPGVEGEGSSRNLPSRTAQEPPSPTPCDLEGAS